jgi:hypothetical protein
MLAHLRRWWSLSGREGFGFLSPSRRACEAGFSTFQEMKCLFFHYAGREETEVNGGHRGDWTLDRTRSVSAQRLRVSRYSDRTRWCVRSWLTGCVRSLWMHTGLIPNAGTVASSLSSSASGRYSLEHCSGLTSVSGQLRDQHVRSSFARG